MTSLAARFGCPRVASRQISALARVQYPIPVKMLSDLRHCLTHTKATVLKVKPQASITAQPSRSMGKVIQRNRAQSPAAIRDTGSALMASMLMVG